MTSEALKAEWDGCIVVEWWEPETPDGLTTVAAVSVVPGGYDAEVMSTDGTIVGIYGGAPYGSPFRTIDAAREWLSGQGMTPEAAVCLCGAPAPCDVEGCVAR